MDNLIIVSRHKNLIRPWLEVLSVQYSLFFSDNIETIISDKDQVNKTALLIIDACLIDEPHQLLQISQFNKKVIIIGEKLTPKQQIQFIYDGACGYSEKSIEKQLILRIIESVLNDEIWLKRKYIPQILKKVISKHNLTINNETVNKETYELITILTQRELEVVEHVYNGKDNDFIAEQLNISSRTVKAHLSSIFRKLNVKDKFRLVVFIKNLQENNQTG